MKLNTYNRLRTIDQDAEDANSNSADYSNYINGEESDDEVDDYNDNICEDMDDNSEILSENGVQLRNDKPFPISRAPMQHRDWVYSWMFLLHFFLDFLFSIVEHKSLNNSFLDYRRAGSWSSVLMIVTLLGSFFGVISFFIISISDTRETFLSFGLLSSIILKICIGNMILIQRSEFWIFGLFVIISAIIDVTNYRALKEGIYFAIALIQMVNDVSKKYGAHLFMTCASIVCAQTLVLLWWGAYFTGILSEAPQAYTWPLVIFMLLSLYWITQFFHSLISFIVGGCILWSFVKEEDEEKTEELNNSIVHVNILSDSMRSTGFVDDELKAKLALYIRCACTTSLGSLCKAALFVPLSNLILNLNHWVNLRLHSSIQNENSHINCSARSCLANLINPFLETASRHNKLALCLTAVYGRSFCATSAGHAAAYPETIDISVEDKTCRILNCTATAFASIISILFAIVQQRRSAEENPNAWPLFFLVCFYLSYSGLSLAIHIYSSAIDAIVVSSAINPMKFASENQIVFLRFLRTSETGLR